MKLYSLKPRLREIRKKNGLKQEQLADKMRVALKTVQNWEQGKALPPFEVVIKLCDILQCDADYLIGRIDCQTHDNQFIQDWTGLNEETIEKLHNWKQCDDRRKKWCSFTSQIIDDSRYDQIMSEMTEYAFYQYIERMELEKGQPVEAIETIDLEIARIWHISKLYTEIIEHMSL